MATRAVYLPTSAELPASAFAALKKDAQERFVLAFDASTDENVYWSGVMPQGISGTLTAVISYYMVSAASGAVRFQVALEAVTAADALDLDSASDFDTDNSNGATVPGTQGYLGQLSVTLTNADSATAGDYYRLRVRRDADGTSGTDDATGDCHVLSVELRDAA